MLVFSHSRNVLLWHVIAFWGLINNCRDQWVNFVYGTLSVRKYKHFHRRRLRISQTSLIEFVHGVSIELPIWNSFPMTTFGRHCLVKLSPAALLSTCPIICPRCQVKVEELIRRWWAAFARVLIELRPELVRLRRWRMGRNSIDTWPTSCPDPTVPA